MALNDDQLLAVRADPRVPLLIKAGPGSGKTLTLLHRILFLLPTLLPTENILLLTFSKAAVKEMQTRLLPHMDDKKNDVVRVSTFHSFCYQVIRDHYSFLHFTSSPKVISSKERKNVLLYAIKNCSPSNPDLQSLDKTQMNALLRLINELKRATNVDKFISERNCKEFVKDIFVAYQKRIKDLNYIEFADMVPLADELFKAHPSTLSQYVQKYKYVLCDEFQDTNAPQRRILFSLAPEGRISVVGDPNQLIYAFQGADLANFEEFEKTFSNISSAAVNAVTLSVNYRSTAAIVRVTNEILRCRAESESLPLASNMRASESNGPGSPVLIVECLGGEEAEWSFILSHIESLLSRGGSSASNIAVLCRDNDTASRIGDFLSARGGLGVQLSLEDKSVEEDEELSDDEVFEASGRRRSNIFVTKMELALNPSDDELCIIALPQELIALDKVHNCIVRCSQQRKFSSVAPRPLFEELRLVAGGSTKMRNWLKGVDKLIATLADNAVTLPNFVEKAVMSCGIAAPMHMKRKFSTSFSTAGQDDNSPLQQKALKEEANKWHADRRKAFQQTLLEQTKGFIEHVKSRLSEDGLLQRDNICGLDREGKIWVGTIHKAKGRQFGAVIVPCALDGIFGGSSRSSVAFEDDRRLLYVAASRAEKDLCFTYQGAYSAETQRKRMTLFLTSSAALPCVLQTQYPPQKVEPLTATKKSVYERSPTKLLPQHVVTNNYAGYNVYTRKL